MSKADWVYKIIKKYELEAEIVDRIFHDNPELEKAFRSDSVEDRAEEMENDFNISTEKGAIKTLEKIADQWKVDLEDEYDINPVNQIHELEDSPRKCFVWDTSMTDQQIQSFTGKVRNEFIKKYNRDPQSLHFIRNDINSIKELSPEEVKARVEPWLNQK